MKETKGERHRMKKMKIATLLMSTFAVAALIIGCGAGTAQGETMRTDGKTEVITPDTEIRQIENGLSAVRYDGDYWFSQFLERGGASSDSAVVQFLTGQLQLLSADIGFETGGFGCM